ncbi:PIG-L family deacetylase [Clostridium perfringens]
MFIVMIKENLLKKVKNIYYFIHYKKFNPKINFKEVEKVLFVAHPDDELIFFYNKLVNEKGWLVVCMTNGDSRLRGVEFVNLMNHLGVKYKILNKPDGLKEIFDEKEVSAIIKEILSKKECWVNVATHNIEGEYGHNQHKQLNKIVKEVYNGKITVPIYIKNLIDEKNKLNKAELDNKKYLFKSYYKSQIEMLNYLKDYFLYENTIVEDKNI